MPDPTKQTLSATETPALLGLSPYCTPWMLFQKFAKGVDIDKDEDARMSWGKKLEPLVLAQAAEELKLEVRPNVPVDYVRRGPLGCTRDAIVICPDRGPGALETKCVFDFRIWQQDWDGGKRVPQRHEIQNQQQIYVGDGVRPYAWGMVAAWVAGEMHYFEREPIPAVWERLELEATTFFDNVKEGRAPDPFGAPVELPWLTQLMPVKEGKVIDLRQDPRADELLEKVIQWRLAKDTANANNKTAEALKAELLAIAGDAEKLLLPLGATVEVCARKRKAYTVKESVSKVLSCWVPDRSSMPLNPTPQADTGPTWMP